MNKLELLSELTFDYYVQTELKNKLEHIAGNENGISLIEYKLKKINEQIQNILRVE